jgi:hypothetical protein
LAVKPGKRFYVAAAAIGTVLLIVALTFVLSSKNDSHQLTGRIIAKHTSLFDKGLYQAGNSNPCGVQIDASAEVWQELKSANELTIKNQSGDIIATVPIASDGVTHKLIETGAEDVAYFECWIPLQATKVRSAAYYRIYLGDYLLVTYSKSDLVAKDWKLELKINQYGYIKPINNN